MSHVRQLRHVRCFLGTLSTTFVLSFMSGKDKDAKTHISASTDLLPSPKKLLAIPPSYTSLFSLAKLSRVLARPAKAAVVDLSSATIQRIASLQLGLGKVVKNAGKGSCSCLGAEMSKPWFFAGARADLFWFCLFGGARAGAFFGSPFLGEPEPELFLVLHFWGSQSQSFFSFVFWLEPEPELFWF